MDIIVGILSLIDPSAEDALFGVIISGIFIFVVLCAIFRIHLVKPGHYLVVVDHFQGRYLTKSSGVQFLWWWQTSVKNPWDYGVEWPCAGRQIEIDPASVPVLCALNKSGGTARGSCDVRMVLSVKTSLLHASSDDIVKVLQESQNHADIISAVTNEYVRDVCTHIPYSQCTETSFVSQKLLEQKSKLDHRIAHFLLVVESFIVEKITFDLDVQKHEHDKTEYNHQRECQNKIMEAKVIEQETKNRKARAEIDQEILLSEAKAKSEATAVASERQHQIEREHLRRMNELEAEHLRQKNELASAHKRELISLLGQSNYAQICALEALGEWKGAHLLPSSFLGFSDVKGILDRAPGENLTAVAATQ